MNVLDRIYLCMHHQERWENNESLKFKKVKRKKLSMHGSVNNFSNERVKIANWNEGEGYWGLGCLHCVDGLSLFCEWYRGFGWEYSLVR